MRRYPKDRYNKETYLQAGELVLWKWTALKRFFPPGTEHIPVSERLFRSGQKAGALSFIYVDDAKLNV